MSEKKKCACGEDAETAVFFAYDYTNYVVTCHACLPKHQATCEHRWISHSGYPDKCWYCRKESL